MFLSVITIGEIARGIAPRQQTDPVPAAVLARWLDWLSTNHTDRMLSIDDDVAIAWGDLMARWTLPVPDGLIGATARVHDLNLVTCNVADFADTGVGSVNLWGRNSRATTGLFTSCGMDCRT